jgi:hypothetical protein
MKIKKWNWDSGGGGLERETGEAPYNSQRNGAGVVLKSNNEIDAEEKRWVARVIKKGRGAASFTLRSLNLFAWKKWNLFKFYSFRFLFIIITYY